MVVDSIRYRIYLIALLQHIPHDRINRKVEELLSHDKLSIEKILSLSDRYALTKNGNINYSFSFVGSPFENLNCQNKVGVLKYNYKIPTLPLSIERKVFPSRDDYPDPEQVFNLWNRFNAEFEDFELSPESSLRLEAESVLNLLHKYATAIPNPSDINQEVSWYDYAKIKAGLAVCIYDYLKEEKKGIEAKISDEDETILIIRADLSGIQNFIYDIASKQASKNLKGRSFYVQLLSDSVLLKMLEEFQLYQGNVMYASGGNFFVIAPHTERVKAAFTDFEHKISKAIFEKHGTRISVVMGYQKVSQKEIFDGVINNALKNLFEEKIDRNKKRKFSSLIQDNYSTFFNPFDVGAKEATDVITGEEILTTERNVFKITENSSLPQRANQEDIKVGVDLIKEATAKQIFLGHNLKDVKYLIATREILEIDLNRIDEMVVNPADLGVNFYLVKEEDMEKFRKALVGCSHYYKIFAINEPQIGNLLLKKNSSALSFLYYGGNKAPVVKDTFKNDQGEIRYVNSPKYFNELAGEGEGRFKRLAVLKMDVDGLGNIFKDVNPKHLTFSYYAALSRHLDWFFKGYLNTLWENTENFREYTQIIYSGGDDLFIIGRWDVIIAFAEIIQKEFADFTCAEKLDEQARVTISGGVSIVTNKFPIIKAAAFADEAEKKAKRHELIWTENEKKKWPQQEYSEFKKNSINLFGKSLHWNTEFLLVKELKEALVMYVSPSDDKKLGFMSLLGKIRSHHSMMKQYEIKKNKGYRVNPRWIWNVAYDFSRFQERQRKEVQDFIKKIKDQIEEDNAQYLSQKLRFLEKIQQGIFTNSFEDNEGTFRKIDSRYHFLELLNLAARWAELEIRCKIK